MSSFIFLNIFYNEKVPAIENRPQDSRIEFGQLREIVQSPTQLTFDLENASQTTLFDSGSNKYPEVSINEGREILVFDDKDLEIGEQKLKDQISIKSFGAYPDSDPDQLYLHYTDKDNLDFDEDSQRDEGFNDVPSISFQKSALYSRRRNRFRTR